MNKARGSVLGGALALVGCSLLTSLDELRPTDAGADRSVPGDSGGDGPACGDTQSSSSNCGTCGHDCLGGDCQKGVCQPVKLASQQQGLGTTQLAQDDANVYWLVNDGVNPPTIMRAAKRLDDAGAAKVGSMGIASAKIITALSPQVLVAANDGKKSFVYAIDGGEPSTGIAPVAMANYAGAAVNAFFVDATHVYLLQQASPACDGGTCLLVSGRDGAGTTTLWTAGSPQDLVTIDGDQLIVASQQNLLAVRAKDPGPTSLGVLSHLPNSIAADKDGIYFTSTGTAAVYSVPRGGVEAGATAPAIDNGGYGTPRLITAGGGRLVWVSTNGSNAEIHGCATNDCGVSKQTLLATSPAISAVAVDPRAVYWADSNKATIFMVAW